MAAPVRPKIIGIKVNSGTAEEYIKITNLTSGGTLTAKLNSDGEAVFNPALIRTWSEGDVIHAVMSGRINQCAEGKISKGGINFKFNNTATTTMANISL